METGIARKIMLVEDELVVRMSLADYLEDSGYEVSQVDSPHEALAILANALPDLVICDYKMPGMSGMEFLEHMRREFPAIPVIVFTGLADDSLADELVAKGAAACLFKPLPTLKVLLETIEKTM